nr:adhesion G protein-coupled receptor L3 [Nothobranchius furzeri]
MWTARLLVLASLFAPAALAFSRAPIPMAVVRRELSCESYPIELRCPGTDVIMIESANYGRTDDKICDADPAQMENTRCYLPDAYKIMSQRCNNRTQCAVVAGPDVFPDPCPGTYKYLEVQYECVPYKVEQKVFLCPGLLRRVYQSEHLFESDHQSGAWCKDPLQASDKIYYMPWTPYRTDTLTEYSSKEDFVAGRPTTTYKLPHRVDGTGFVVYDGALFFNKERTRNIVKFDLRTRIKSGEAIIANANYHDTSPYRWGGKSDIDLAVDENGLWVIYATEQNNGRIVISQLNPYTLRVEGTWDTAYDKRSASNAFMICGILYVVKSVYEDDDNEATGNKIDYIYNTELSKDGFLDIPFPNSYQYIAAVDYNPRDNLLYVWNNYHVVKYSLDFGALDNRLETSSSIMVYMDATTSTTRTTTRPSTVTLTSTTTRITTTRMPATTAAMAQWPRATSTMVSPVQTLVEALLPDDSDEASPSSKLPNIKVEYCNPLVVMDISWPKTKQGTVAKMPCPPGTIGVASYMCLGPEGFWDLMGPDFSNCTSPWVNIISQKLKAGETAAVIARELAEQTKSNLQAGDITYTVKAMIQLVDLLDVQLRNLTPGGKDSAARSLNKLQKRERSCRFYVQAMVETVNNLLQPQAQAAWRELSTGEQLRAATMLLDTVEQGAFVLADNLLKTDIVQENTDNIQLEVARMSTDGNLPDLKFPQGGGQGNSIHLSANTLKQHGRNGEIRIAFVLYKHIGVYLSTENASMKLGSEALATNYSVIVNSPVITAAINKDANKVYLSDPVVFTIKHLQQSEENFNPNCSFWSYSKKTMTGYWSTQDCRLLSTNRTHTTCSCTHLTNFAVLMAHVDVKNSDPVHDIMRLLHSSDPLCFFKFFQQKTKLKYQLVNEPCFCHFRSWVIGAIALLCLLGLTWAFGLMYVNESTVVMAYLFTIFNSLQGMFIFIFHCVLQKKVRKEYGKCFRTHCCSGKSVDSSIGSVKGTASRAPGRYSSGSQSRIRRMWNDTVRKQSESSFMTGDINSSASLNRGAMANHLIPNALLRPHGTNNPYNTLLGESAVYNNPLGMYNTQEPYRETKGILNNARDTSVMDTLPLNGNHGNSYSIASAEYMSDCVQIIDRGYNHKETTLEKKILKELTSNYIPSYLNNSNEQNRNLMNKLVNNVSNGGKDNGYGMGLGVGIGMNIALNLDDHSTFSPHHDEGLGLELIREESNAPLLPQRPLPTLQAVDNLHNHLHQSIPPPLPLSHHPFSAGSTFSSSRRRIPQENSESFFPLLNNEHTEDEGSSPSHSHQRDSLYNSMPMLPGLPDVSTGSANSSKEGGDAKSPEASSDDVYYKSMPNLGSRNHLHQLHSYYQLGRGSSDGFIAPPNREDLTSEEAHQDPSHLVTSL